MTTLVSVNAVRIRCGAREDQKKLWYAVLTYSLRISRYTLYVNCTVVNVRFSMLREYRPVRGDDRLKFDYSWNWLKDDTIIFLMQRLDNRECIRSIIPG